METTSSKCLKYCYLFPEFYNEDAEILGELRTEGDKEVLFEDVVVALKQLHNRGLINLKEFRIGGFITYMARINYAGKQFIGKKGGK